MTSEKILLCLEDKDEELSNNFPRDPKGDYQIVIGQKDYKLQTKVLQSFSEYFATKETNESFQAKIEKFEEKIVENMLSIMYGKTVSIDRTEVSAYYELGESFKFGWLLKHILNDMYLRLEEYDIFFVMKIAHEGKHKNLFDLCLNELEKEEFEQLKYHQMHLLGLEKDLFEVIVKANNINRVTKKKGLSYKRINQIIQAYCEFNGLGSDAFEDMKAEIFDVSILSSTEFKEIFYDYFCKSNFYQSSINSLSTCSESINNSVNCNQSNSRVIKFGDVIVEKDSFSLKLFIENTMLKKKNLELEKQNRNLIEEVKQLISLCSKNKSVGKEMQNNLSDSNSIEIPQKDPRKQVEELTDVINVMNKDFEKKISEIEQMFRHISQKERRNSISEVKLNKKMWIVSKTINETFTNALSDIKDNELEKLSEFEQNFIIPPVLELPNKKFINRISFNEAPTTLSEKHFPLLSEMVTNSFKKKFFQIIYRRCKNSLNKGTKNSLLSRGNLLILIKTRSDIEMGGYITASIPNEKLSELADNGAFIFNLNKNRKYLVRDEEKRRSLKFSEGKLLCFGDDLQIPDHCFEKKGICGGPEIYGDDSTREVIEGGKWIYGKSEFEIDSLEVYEVIEDDMEMVLL